MKQSLFRSIRRKLLNEGKLLRYLTYAIGEVLLIIVGILLTLKIYDWNEDRKAQAEFDEYIVQLRFDVREVIDYLVERVAAAEERMETWYAVIRFLESPQQNENGKQDFERAFVALGRAPSVDIRMGLLGRILEGDTDLISRNEALAQEVIDLEFEVKRRVENLGILRDRLEQDSSIIDRYRGRVALAIPDMQLQYDLEDLRNSKEFRYAAQNVIARLSTIATLANGIKENLEDFLTILEEYDKR